MSKWTVELSGKAKKADKLLSKNAYKAFLLLLVDLKSGPEAPGWPNYGKLGSMTYHCHLKKGRPTYVACWTADKKNKIRLFSQFHQEEALSVSHFNLFGVSGLTIL